MIQYKRELLASIDKLIVELKTAKICYTSQQQDYYGASFFSIKSAWEMRHSKECVHITDTMLSLLGKLRKEFIELT